jgi:hypothetical protein
MRARQKRAIELIKEEIVRVRGSGGGREFKSINVKLLVDRRFDDRHVIVLTTEYGYLNDEKRLVSASEPDAWYCRDERRFLIGPTGSVELMCARTRRGIFYPTSFIRGVRNSVVWPRKSSEMNELPFKKMRDPEVDLAWHLDSTLRTFIRDEPVDDGVA